MWWLFDIEFLLILLRSLWPVALMLYLSGFGSGWLCRSLKASKR